MKPCLASAFGGASVPALVALVVAGCAAHPQVSTGGSKNAPGRPCAATTASARALPAASNSAGKPVLTGVRFVSASTGWVVGSDRILRTDDGGASWVTQYRTGAAAQLATVDFVDASHGWVIGRSAILATADGGAHWHALPEPCRVVRAVHFVSPAVGFAVAGGALTFPDLPSAGGVLLRSTDGGRTWQLMTTPADVQTACFGGAERGWLGANGNIYGTVNGGRTWTLALRGSTGVGGNGVPAIAQVRCAGSSAAWAEVIGLSAAMNQAPHVGYHTFGATWQPIFAEQYFPHPGVRVRASAPGELPGPFSAISPAQAVFIDYCAPCSSAATPQLQGTAPMDIATRGGAVLAARGAVSRLANATGAAFVSIDVGWVVGTQTSYPTSGTGAAAVVSRIMRTTDGGRTWQVQYTLRQ